MKIRRSIVSYMMSEVRLIDTKKEQKKELVQAANTFLDFDRTVITILKPALSKKEKKELKKQTRKTQKKLSKEQKLNKCSA